MTLKFSLTEVLKSFNLSVRITCSTSSLWNITHHTITHSHIPQHTHHISHAHIYHITRITEHTSHFSHSHISHSHISHITHYTITHHTSHNTHHITHTYVIGSEKTCHVEKTTYFHIFMIIIKQLMPYILHFILFSLNVQKCSYVCLKNQLCRGKIEKIAFEINSICENIFT